MNLSLRRRTQSGLKPSMLITDIGLGIGPDGWELARIARASDAALKVVYISGSIGEGFDEAAVPKSVILQKPIGLPDLLVAVGSPSAAA